MNTGHPRLNVVKENAPRPSSPKRDRALAWVVAGVLFASQTAAAVSPEVEVAKLSRETVYFPSQHVDQGGEINEPAPTF